MTMFKTTYRVTWKFFWHGYNFREMEFDTLAEARACIKDLRLNQGFKNRSIRLLIINHLK